MTLSRSFPLIFAFSLTFGYGVLASAWIFASTGVASGQASDVTELANLEVIKGISFVVVTAVALFLFTWLSVLRQERLHQEALARAALVGGRPRGSC